MICRLAARACALVTSGDRSELISHRVLPLMRRELTLSLCERDSLPRNVAQALVNMNSARASPARFDSSNFRSRSMAAPSHASSLSAGEAKSTASMSANNRGSGANSLRAASSSG
jgi:hypothetical protein